MRARICCQRRWYCLARRGGSASEMVRALRCVDQARASRGHPGAAGVLGGVRARGRRVARRRSGRAWAAGPRHRANTGPVDFRAACSSRPPHDLHDRRAVRRPVCGRHDNSHAGTGHLGQLGGLGAAWHRGVPAVFRPVCRIGPRDRCAVGVRAGQIRPVSHARLSGARFRPRRVPGASGPRQRSLAWPTIRRPEVGGRHRDDVGEPGEVQLSRMVCAAAGEEAVSRAGPAVRDLHYR